MGDGLIKHLVKRVHYECCTLCNEYSRSSKSSAGLFIADNQGSSLALLIHSHCKIEVQT
jgi:hypothetical protein